MSHLFLHGVRAVRRGSGQERREIHVQRRFGFGSERQDLEPRVQPAQLLLQTAQQHQDVNLGREYELGHEHKL